MDILQFDTEIVNYYDSSAVAARITVNGQPLIGTVKDYELPYAKKYGQESIAGGYSYVPIKFLYKFLAEEYKTGYYSEKVPILICGGCGFVGCWDFSIDIKACGDEVIWANGRNTYRSSPECLGGFWDYSDFPEFHFSAENYTSQMQKLKVLAEKHRD
ncbi:MAG: hypothetical protein LBN02_01375 [Oscillospiraceae bacterium]|jgi:hypothetical protein|nr:hypothetical protein [Oscillospiraceae bacterium]